jgi:hypothetical protein
VTLRAFLWLATSRRVLAKPFQTNHTQTAVPSPHSYNFVGGAAKNLRFAIPVDKYGSLAASDYRPALILPYPHDIERKIN